MKNYEDEVINVKANIIIGIFDFLAIFSLYIAIVQYLNNDFGLEILIVSGCLSLIFIITCSMLIFLNIYCVTWNNKITKEIVENGEKIKGQIIRIKREYNFDKNATYFKRAAYFRKFSSNVKESSNGIKKAIYYYAIVKYNYKDKKYIIKSPSLNFFPGYVENKEVDIFLYEDKYYIDNYKINFLKMENDKKEYNKMRITIIGMFFSMCLLGAITIYLSIIKNLKMEIAIRLCILYMFIYAIISLIIYFKYWIKKK